METPSARRGGSGSWVGLIRMGRVQKVSPISAPNSKELVVLMLPAILVLLNVCSHIRIHSNFMA